MDLEARLALVREVGEEIVTEEELRALLAAKAHPIAYDGFEPSGTAHIAQGVMRALNVNKMTKAGFRFKMFVADWHAWANNKLGGDLERIQTTGKYLIEIWRATGMDLSKVDFVWASEFIEDEAYWKKVMNIARDTSLDRVLRTTQIMGRSDKDKLSAAQILYPCMQAADIFHLQADVTQLGMDQRKVNMLAREVGPKLGFWKPVVISHHMLIGLRQPPPPLPSQQEAAARGATEILERISMSEIYGTFEGSPMPVFEALVAKLQEPGHGFGHYRIALEQAVAACEKLAGESLSTQSETLEKELQEYYVQRVLSPSTEEPAEGLPRKEYTSEELAAGVKQRREEGRPGKAGRVLKNHLERYRVLISAYDARQLERQMALKMSKSNLESAIFMTDTPEQVQAKIKKAYCPAKQAQDNPILEYYRYIVFERFPDVTIERPAKFGGDVAFASYGELERAFVEGNLGPVDAKAGMAKYLNQLLDPVREHFEKNSAARDLKQQVDGFKVTR